jgi:hypothetical protein
MKFHILDILADDAAIAGVQTLEPFAHRLAPRIGAIKPCRQALENRLHSEVSIMVRPVKNVCGRKCSHEI